MSVIDSMTMSAPAPEVELEVANQPIGSGERSRTMIIIGVDFHPEFQQIALLNTTTGEVEEKTARTSRRGGADCKRFGNLRRAILSPCQEESWMDIAWFRLNRMPRRGTTVERWFTRQ